MPNRKVTVSELDLLNQIKNMNEDEKSDFRLENKNHEDRIAKRTVRNFISRFIKRCIDIFAGIIGTVILIPLALVIWVVSLIYKETDGPLFYSQTRIGQNGKLFKIYKFRSMVSGADKILAEYLASNPEAAKEYQITKKLTDDPRITKTGKFIRRTSLDEWPQFINILIGQMSLVGPRPYLESEKQDMGEYYDYIIKMKPGLTGPWQVAGRSALTFEDRLMLDEEYISRCGNRRDFLIIIKTFKRVFNKEGAI